jgi:translation initiation factor 2 gamma subunit (eIF-2gamma)
MATMLNGAAVMDAALLLIGENIRIGLDKSIWNKSK